MMADRVRAHPKAVRHGSSAALILIGVIAIYNWVLAPHLGCLHAMQKLGFVVGHVAKEKDRICSTLDTKVSQRQTLQRELAELEEGVFTAEQAKTFLRGLLPLVEETGCVVVLADFAGKGKPERIEDPNGPVVVEASHPSLDAEGRPEQVSALLQRLGDHRPRIWMDSCQLDLAPGDSGRMACHLALTFYTVGNRTEPAKE
jgi:hypothetical protein